MDYKLCMLICFLYMYDMQCMHYIPSHLIVYICNSVDMAMSACIFFTYLSLICCNPSQCCTNYTR